MYIKIEENILKEWANWEFESSTYVELDYEEFCQNQDKYQVIDGNLCDISETSEYLSRKAQEEKVEKEAELIAQIDTLDIKRIRAIAEPEIKDEETGETWVDYYTKIIQEIREQIIAL